MLCDLKYECADIQEMKGETRKKVVSMQEIC